MIYSLKPVFIFGCDRSGTTMLGDMLGSHHDAIVTPESQFFHELLLMMHNRAFSTPHELVEWLRGHFRYAVWNVDDPHNQLLNTVNLDDPRSTIESIIYHYIRRNKPDIHHARFWIDHTPDNMRYYAVLKHYFPDASFIHIVRDGRAVFSSVKRLDWGPNNAYMGTRFWSERIREAMLVEIAEAGNCLRVRYEDIVEAPEIILQQICQHVRIPYEFYMVDGGGLVLPGFTQSQHKLVGRRPDPSRLQAWQQSLRAREIGEFESYEWSRLYLQCFGYPLLSKPVGQLSLAGIIWRYCHEGMMYAIHRLRHRAMEKSTVKRYIEQA